MTKTQKIWNKLVPLYWMKKKEKQVWSGNEPPYLTVKLSGKNKAMKHVYFIRIPMEGQCDLNAQFLCIILRE